MATNKNITMKQFNGTDYDTLYPKTIASQIPDVYSKTEILTADTLSKYGLTFDKLPNDVFQQIKTLIDNVQASAYAKARIQTGSYVGTGTYGASNPCSLTFDFVPKFLYVKSTNSSSAGFFLPHTLTNTFKNFAYQGFIQNAAIQSSNCYGKMEGTTLSWYNKMTVGDAAGEQFNNSGTYHYIALS